MDVLNRIPVREQDAKERATNFDEVCLGYNEEEAVVEAARCIKCNKLWNISIKAIIPKNGYKCPKCRFKENIMQVLV